MVIAPELTYKISYPADVQVKYQDYKLTVIGPLGEVSRIFKDDRILLTVTDAEIVLYLKLPRRKEYATMGTWQAHIKNMIKGVKEGFVYKLKVVYAHFPVKVTVKGNLVIIENFLGEKSARKAVIADNTHVEVHGDIITVSGSDIEKVGQTAANIERATKIKRFDPRVFQDGIYIISKGVS